MKIVEIIPSLNSASGGAEVLFVNICKEIKKDGHDITIITLYDGICDRFRQSLEGFDISIIQLSKKRGADLKCANKLKNALKTINPDVVHFHLGVVLTYYLAFHFRKTHWKTFCTIHNVPEKDETKIGNHLRKQYAKKDLIGFVGISNTITSQSKSFYQINSITTIENGVALKGKQSTKEERKKYDFVCVAVFKEAKNHKMLFNCIKEAQKTEPSISLACVGEGPLFEEMKEYLKQIDVKNVELLGQRDDVYSVLNQSSCFVLSSIYEGNPISILEAMDAGLPIIAPIVGGIPDVVKNNENGILFTVNSNEELINALLKMKADDKLKEKMGEANSARSHLYSVEHCAKQYLNLFK